MNKKQGLLIGIVFVLLFTGIALATSSNSSTSSDVEIYAFDQNPAGSDKGNEWVTLYNPSNESADNKSSAEDRVVPSSNLGAPLTP